MFQIGKFTFEKYLIKDHASMRMLYRNISVNELEELMHFGKIIEDYPNDFPFPSILIFKMVNLRPLHAVIAFSAEDKMAIIVTLYEPDLLHFEPDFKTRKKL